MAQFDVLLLLYLFESFVDLNQASIRQILVINGNIGNGAIRLIINIAALVTAFAFSELPLVVVESQLLNILQITLSQYFGVEFESFD